MIISNKIFLILAMGVTYQSFAEGLTKSEKTTSDAPKGSFIRNEDASNLYKMMREDGFEQSKSGSFDKVVGFVECFSTKTYTQSKFPRTKEYCKITKVDPASCAGSSVDKFVKENSSSGH